MIDIKTDREIEKMREVCKIVALAHEEIRKAIKVGMTTKEIDDITERVLEKMEQIHHAKVILRILKIHFQRHLAYQLMMKLYMEYQEAEF